MTDTTTPKIYLVHAMQVSMAPIADCFGELWPDARVANVLDDSLYADFGRSGRLTDALFGRCLDLGRYCASAGADAILFTGSVFSPAVDAVKAAYPIPVLKPNEALYDAVMARGGRAALLTTFGPTLTLMQAELDALRRDSGSALEIRPCLVEGALDAGLKIRTLCLPDVFQDQDNPAAMYATAGLNADHIAAAALQALGVEATRAVRA